MLETLQQVCSQLIKSSDLVLEKEIANHLVKYNFAMEVLDNPTVIKIYSYTQFTLSDIIPILHDFNFIVNNEISFTLIHNEKTVYVIKLYLDMDETKQLKAHQKNITEILHYVLESESRMSCALFSLAYTQNFCMKTILLLRSLGHYANQLALEFNIPKIFHTLIKHDTITQAFFKYFSVKFDPKSSSDEKSLNRAKEHTETLLRDVQNSEDDRILKLFFEIMLSCVRTNYYLYKDTIAIKIDLKNLKAYLKGIQPQIEIFVYNREFRGTHMRMDSVARGGLRYSTRKDDYRNEVKSLMTAQESKNAIIVPSGAKGGFIIDKPKSQLSMDEFKAYYSAFIESLLELVDNVKDGKIVRDERIIAYDGEDTYFVVAADKGTASMSDVANQIAKDRGFWIDDAFASGGSNGFHHKKLGITAKGAIKSVERFFIEKGVNFYKEPITIVGIGSMSGDVFGNGMIESEQFKLLGAISHDEIFIDPDPDIKVAYEERVRLFSAKEQKWSNYDTSKISASGGVFKRSAHNISLNVVLQKLLQTNRKKMDGEELANALLKIPVDMLYNGGVGTYIKSSEESNLEVGDKENEYVRVDANEVQAFCICEGGNLGLTQRARYEYALGGGEIYLDSIDNAAGVNTSDHEVNLKIILAKLAAKNFITNEQRSKTLKSLTPHVVSSVLWSNYLQSLCLAQERKRSLKQREKFITILNLLENNIEVFKRKYFSIPRDIDFGKIVNKNGEIITPVLSVILLYAKIFLTQILNENNLYEGDSFFDKYLFKYFPKEFLTLYEDAVRDHPLKDKIISMMISNKIINNYGATFLCNYEKLGKKKFLLKIKAYLISNQLYDANDVRYEIYRNDYEIPVSKQSKMLFEIEEKIDYNINWMLRTLEPEAFSFETVLDYKSAIHAITDKININKIEIIESNDEINSFFSRVDYLKFTTAIIKVNKQTGASFERCTMLFFHIIKTFEIAEILKHIENVTIQYSNEKLLQEQLELLLEALIVDVTKDLLAYQRSNETADKTLQSYLEEHEFDLDIYKSMLNDIKSNETSTISDLSVIVNHFLLIKS